MIIERLLLLLLFLIGLYGIIGKKHIIRKIFGLNIINTAVVLLFILEGSRIGEAAPIADASHRAMVDPIPQALMLTAIVIGVCITALSLALSVHLYRVTGSFDIDEIRIRIHHES